MATSGQFPVTQNSFGAIAGGRWPVRTDGCWQVATASVFSVTSPCCCDGCASVADFQDSGGTYKDTIQLVISGVTLGCCVPFNSFFFSLVSGDPNGTYCLRRMNLGGTTTSRTCVWAALLATPIVLEGRATAGCAGTLRQTNTYNWVFVMGDTNSRGYPGLGGTRNPHLIVAFNQAAVSGLSGESPESSVQQGIGPFYAYNVATPNCTNGTYSNISTVCATGVSQPQSNNGFSQYFGAGVGGSAVVDFGGC